MIAVPRRALSTSPLSRTTRWADSLHPNRKFPMPVFEVKCCQYWPWECHFFPALSVFLCHSCYHCQSVENYRISVGKGLNLHNLLFVACCCRGGGRRDSAFYIQFVHFIGDYWVRFIPLIHYPGIAMHVLSGLSIQWYSLFRFGLLSLLANYFSQQLLSSPLLSSPPLPSPPLLSLSLIHTHTQAHAHIWDETHYSIVKFRTHWYLSQVQGLEVSGISCLLRDSWSSPSHCVLLNKAKQIC